MIDEIVKKTTLHLDRAKLALAEIKGWSDDFGCDIFEYSEIFKKKASLASLLPLYAASFSASAASVAVLGFARYGVSI